jgi:benzoyl-CoA reductase/2-hydroxyglutaryl-CoA dehydratase subunit BcrC/BadD/HgdB
LAIPKHLESFADKFLMMGPIVTIDGVIFHANRSCKPYSFGQEEIARRLKSVGIECILMDGDMADERDFAEGGWRIRLEAFV